MKSFNHPTLLSEHFLLNRPYSPESSSEQTLNYDWYSATFNSAAEYELHLINDMGIEPGLVSIFENLPFTGKFTEPDTADSCSSASTMASDSLQELKTIACPKCDNLYKNLQGMHQHMAKMHQKRRKPAVCEECGKGFKHKYALKFHERQVHEGATKVQCQKCGKSVYNKYMVSRHHAVCGKS